MFIRVHLRHNFSVKKGLLLIHMVFFAKIILKQEKVDTFQHILGTLI